MNLLIISLIFMSVFSKNPQNEQAAVKRITNDIAKYGIAPLNFETYKKQQRFDIQTDNIKKRIIGKVNTLHLLVVFTDFACSKSQKAHSILKERLKENKNNLSLLYVLFPLDEKCNPNLKGKGRLSDKSCEYVELALCAEKNKKFAEAVDLLFSNKANKVLEIKGIKECMADSEWLKTKLSEENKLYKDFNIKGTPTVLLDKRKTGRIYKNKNKFNGLLHYLDVDFNRTIKK